MKLPDRRTLEKRVEIRLRLFWEGLRRNPNYWHFYDLYSRMLAHNRALNTLPGDPKSLNREALPKDEKALKREAGLLLGKSSSYQRISENISNISSLQCRSFMRKTLKERFGLRLPVNPRDPTVGLTLAPKEIGATLTFDGRTYPNWLQVIPGQSFIDDRVYFSTGRVIVMDLVGQASFMGVRSQHDLSSFLMQNPYCVVLEADLSRPHLGELLGEFRLLLASVKNHVKADASNGTRIRMKTNRELLSELKRLLQTESNYKGPRHRGDDIDSWFLAYDLRTWGMPFGEAINSFGLRGLLNDKAKGLAPLKVAQILFPREYKQATAGVRRRGEEEEEFRSLTRRYIGEGTPGLNFRQAQAKAAKELGIDLRTEHARAKNLLQRVREYVDQAKTYIWMPYNYADCENPQ